MARAEHSADTVACRTSPVIERFRAGRPVDASTDRWLKEGLGTAMPEMRMADLFAARPGLFREAENLVVAVDVGGQPLAALGSRWAVTGDGLRFLHIGVQFVSRPHRGGSVFSASWAVLLADLLADGQFPNIAALRTYNPVAYCAMRDYGRLPGAVMFPEMGEAVADPVVARLAGTVAETLAPGADYEPRTGRIRGIGVPTDLYVAEPTCADPGVNRYFARHTRPGDRILCLVHVRSRHTEAAIVAAFDHRRRRAMTPGLS